MESTQTYYKQYLAIVKTADSLLTQPAYINTDTEREVEDVELYGDCLAKSLPQLEPYPSLVNSMFGLINREDMTGYLGAFVIDEAIASCAGFSQVEEEIMMKIDRIGNSSLSIDHGILAEIAKKAKSWRRIVTLENIPFINSFLTFLLQQINSLYESLSDKEKLGQALAQSEEERRKLLEIEEARKRGITERELDKEEKRQKALEEYAKKLKTRKKK